MQQPLLIKFALKESVGAVIADGNSVALTNFINRGDEGANQVVAECHWDTSLIILVAFPPTLLFSVTTGLPHSIPA
jgi:hypothetical protein